MSPKSCVGEFVEAEHRLTYAPANAPTVLRLCIEVGASGDAYHFQAEVERFGGPVSTVAEFFIDPEALISAGSARYDPSTTGDWIPEQDKWFLQIPVKYRNTFAAMVRQWGQLVGAMVPAEGL